MSKRVDNPTLHSEPSPRTASWFGRADDRLVPSSSVGDAGAGRLWVRWSVVLGAVHLAFGAPLALTTSVNNDAWLFDGSFSHDMILLFHPDAEGGYGAASSAGLMIAAALWSFRWASAVSLLRGRLFSGALLFLAFDDWISLHERLESSLKIDWQVLRAGRCRHTPVVPVDRQTFARSKQICSTALVVGGGMPSDGSPPREAPVER